ncbi:hypothetical protein AALB_1453 [Agarivorans albus MKT 106]|uniref:Uncharacterized protein n=1 Tax=Agarivorans albus MKT 106 TaxID=1331007 RepID=R9PJG2_AGAAL|nr:hypothetical protein AALB_1453 [Agarivorans albus MKT 106]
MDQQFKEDYNVFYFLGFVVALLLPTLPLSLSLLKIFA